MQRDLGDERSLAEEVMELRRRVAELEQERADVPESRAVARAQAPGRGQAVAGVFSAATPGQAALLDAIPAMVFFKDREHRYLLVNKAYADHYGLAIDKIIGRRDEEIFPLEMARGYHDNDEAIMASGVPQLNVELQWKLPDGNDGWTLENNVPYCDEEGRVLGMVGVVIDMTARKRAEEALKRTEAELLATKERLLDTVAALLTPVLPIDSGILVMPLVGHVDVARSEQVMDALLEGAQRYAAEFVIIDVTGVPMLDSGVAASLMRAINAVRLLGARCILAGISGKIARELLPAVDALGRLVIVRNLEAGVRYAMSRRKGVARPRQAVLGRAT